MPNVRLVGLWLVATAGLAGGVGGIQYPSWPSNLSTIDAAAMMVASREPDPRLTVVGFGAVEFAHPAFVDEADAAYWRDIMNKLIAHQNTKEIPLRAKQWYAGAVDVIDKGTQKPVGMRMPEKSGTIAVGRSAAVVGKGVAECSAAWRELPSRYTGLIENNHKNTAIGRMIIPLDKCSQSYYFGHFIDSCLHKLVPLWELALRDDVDIMVDCKFYQGKQQSWAMMLELGFPPSRLKCVGRDPMLSEAHVGVITACSMPHHPALYQKLNQYILNHFKRNVKYLPLEDRKEVLYFTRNPPAGSVEGAGDTLTTNGGRMISNEADFLNILKPWLSSKGLKLVTFKRSSHPNLASMVRQVSNARAIFGMHGGALYNILFAQPGTALVDLNPLDEPWMFYALAKSIGLPYGYLRPTTPVTQEPLEKRDHGRRDAYHVDPYRFIAVMAKVLARGQEEATNGRRNQRFSEL